MRSILTCTATWILAAAVGWAAEPAAPPAFTKKPAASRDGDKVKIDFAADRETDVAVYIENSKGEIVRHLVAGVLGKNPPEPLKPNSLEQSVAWDGKDDDGKPVAGGPFRVRVGLGLRANYAGTAFAEKGKEGPDNIESVWGLACGPDGRVYVLGQRAQWLYWTHNTIHVFLRDGSYEKTIKPFPANAPPERMKAVNAFVSQEGCLTPVIHQLLQIGFYSHDDVRRQHMVVTPDGNLVLAAMNEGGSALGIIAPDGSVPFDSYAGQPLSKNLGQTFLTPFLAASQDSSGVYFTGYGGPWRCDNTLGWMGTTTHAVYRVGLPGRGKPEVFFGDPAAAGGDEKHLSDPQGVAIDGQGHLLVADKGNNRVVVLREKDRTVAGSFAVDAPGWVGVNSKTGAVYVRSGESVVKFSGWKEPKELARLALPARNGKDVRFQWSFALDSSADPTLLWLGRNQGGPALARCEDRGASFSGLEPAKAYSGRMQWSLTADPSRQEVACADGADQFLILDERTGSFRKISVGGRGSWGKTFRLGPNGRIYGMGHGEGIFQTDRTGKLIPFEATAQDPKLKGLLASRPSGTTAWERDFGVARNGDLYVRNSGKKYHGLMTVDVYAPDGKLKGTSIWCVSDGALGPRLDPKGNIYLADCVKPPGKRWPDELNGRLPKGSAEHWYEWTYGSLVKFGPEGGAVMFPPNKNMPSYVYPFEGEPKLAPGLKEEKVAGTFRDGLRLPTRLIGAKWWHYGFSTLQDMIATSGEYGMGGDHCHCTGTDFDVDDFGRSFYPDQMRFRVGVLDTNGNLMLHIGTYGNQDSCGPDSYVLDPKGKFLRPRKADDPKDLKSPFAEPEIAFGWIVGMAVTDKHLYVADSTNRRILRVKLDYAATETVPAP